MQHILSPDNRYNGRWTQEEHEKFILGLQLYGKDWRKIEQLIGSRNGAQIRSHAQKFFIRLKKQTDLNQNEEISKEPLECLSSATTNSKQSSGQEQRHEYSYFLKKIFKSKASQQQDFDFWESLIDQRPKLEFQRGAQICCLGKRKNSFVCIGEGNKKDNFRQEPIKRIKV